jgi:hypothetical protein
MWRSFFLPETSPMAQRVKELSTALVKSTIMVYPEQGRGQRHCR